MPQVQAYDICWICLRRLRWWQAWVGVRRQNSDVGDGFWTRRAHYRCWRDRQEHERGDTPA